MIYIHKNSEPNELTAYKKTLNAQFDDMDINVKEALRESLLKEQGYICAYCMQRIKEKKEVKIEHYIPRDDANQLVYSNLLAVCKGNENEPGKIKRYRDKDQTCDTRKADNCLSVNPQNEAHISTLSYSSSGKILSSDSRFQYDIDMTLNLNQINGYLLQNRKTALSVLKRKLSSLPDSSIESYLKKCRKMYSEYNIQGEYEPYVGILLWYINKKLKKFN